MGFSLEMFFDELFEILDSDMKAAKKIKLLVKVIYEAKQYAKECGHI